jgi:UDP-2,3-diacylglucosamine pyrophosphatase LpxH
MTEGFLRKSLIPQVSDDLQSVRRGTRELLIVFLGDFIDINRSRYWVDGGSEVQLSDGRAYTYYPWSHWRDTLRRNSSSAGMSPDPDFSLAVFEGHVTSVLSRIANNDANRVNLSLWRDLKNPGSALWAGVPNVPDEIRYEFIPGNHDRLANFSSSIRAAFLEHLPLDDLKPSDRQPWTATSPFRWINAYPDYAVVALHGHALDPDNFGGEGAPSDPSANAGYEMPALGDIITVLVAERAVQAVATNGDLPSGLVESIGAIDLVRPSSAMLNWLREWGATNQVVRAVLDQIATELVSGLLKDEFFRRKKGMGQGVLGAFKRVLANLLKPTTLNGAIRFYRGQVNPPSDEQYSQQMLGLMAEGEFADWVSRTYPDTRYLVSGHTHHPLVLALAGSKTATDERMYFNTGCWVDVVEEGQPGLGFARRNQIVHVAFYRADEDTKANGQRSYWEYWQGNLREGPVTPRPTPRAP